MWKGCRVLYWRPRILLSTYQRCGTVGMAEEEPAAKRARVNDGEDHCTELAEEREGKAVCAATAEAEEEEEVVEEGREERIEGGKVRGVHQQMRVPQLTYKLCANLQ